MAARMAPFLSRSAERETGYAGFQLLRRRTMNCYPMNHELRPVDVINQYEIPVSVKAALQSADPYAESRQSLGVLQCL